MKIGIYGGTFNPIHFGHLRTAQEVAEILSLDKVIFIPAGSPPFIKPDLETAAHRYNMVKAAIDNNPVFKISAIEAEKRGKSYTVDTIKKLKDKYSRSELYFILGIDAVLDLPAWKEPYKLINMTNLVIISRPEYSFAQLASLPFMHNTTRSLLKRLDNGKLNNLEFEISHTQKGYLCKVVELNISASYIRNLIRSGKNVNYLLPDSVKSYIISNKLYVMR